MSELTVKSEVHFGTGRRSKKELRKGAQEAPTTTKVPRVARLMALAIKFEQMVRDGEVKDYAEIARVGHVTRARVTQIMSLLALAPDIQESLVFSRSGSGRETITERSLRSVTAIPEWRKQRELLLAADWAFADSSN